MDIWKILDIPPTKDIAEIKSAYARQAKRYHPEEQPEEFKLLQKAYKTALQNARQKEQMSAAESVPAQERQSDIHAQAPEPLPDIPGEVPETAKEEEERAYDFGDVDTYGYRERFFKEFFFFLKNPFLRNHTLAWDCFLNRDEYRELFENVNFRMNFVRTICNETGWRRKTILYFKRFLMQFHTADSVLPDGRRETDFIWFRTRQLPMPKLPYALTGHYVTKEGKKFQEQMLARVQRMTGRSADLNRKEDLEKYIGIYLDYAEANEGYVKYLHDGQQSLRAVMTAIIIVAVIYLAFIIF